MKDKKKQVKKHEISTLITYKDNDKFQLTKNIMSSYRFVEPGKEGFVSQMNLLYYFPHSLHCSIPALSFVSSYSHKELQFYKFLGFYVYLV